MSLQDQGMTLTDWHERYLQQARWTQDVRRHLFKKAGLEPDDKVLEVGVGTGAVLGQIAADYPSDLVGIDIDYQSLHFAGSILPTSSLIQADAHLLPIPDGLFSLTYCHYLLMWVADPGRVIAEMHRVTQPGGYVAALAESDYSGRIDFPPPLDKLGELQTDALQAQGADIRMGRKLGELFNAAGLSDIEFGIFGSQWQTENPQDTDETEWMTILSDLGERISIKELAQYQQADKQARNAGSRVLFIPTFYAIGKV
jgi:ubiquinone/menaquinone biosynthesis C-methylase UbiE